MKLKVSLKSEHNCSGRNQYNNQINAGNFKELSLVLQDLSNHGVPVDKAFQEYTKLKKSDWDILIGG